MFTRPKRITLVLASGALTVLVVTLAPWCYYSESFLPSLSQPRVHDWSLKGPGGRYGITESDCFRRTTSGFERSTATEIWLGSPFLFMRQLPPSPVLRFPWSLWLFTAFSCRAMTSKRFNDPAAGKAGMASLLTIGQHCPGLPEPGCSA